MVTARINTPGVIGKVAVRPNQRTTIADPKFTTKPNVGLVELFDTSISDTVEEGDVITYVASTGKFENQPLGNVSVQVLRINGGFF
jgi:hypothetical protein